MSRLLPVVLLCLSAVFPAFADPLDDLFIAARNGDAARAEAILAAAESPKQRRDMMWMLGGSHEDLRSFAQDWAVAAPDNPVALTAYAWSRYREGFMIRGEDSVDFSWPASLEQASPIIAEAFALAETALALDPAYLPASDAVIIIGEVSGNMSRSQAEAERILELAPNRHSLVIAASSVRRDWLGRIGVKTDLCDSYASKVTDAPGYTAEMCVIEAIYNGSCCLDELLWAAEQISAYVDEPLLRETVLMAAERNHLTPDAADRLRALMIAENSLTVTVALSGRPEILQMQYPAGADPFADLEVTKAALQRDLVATRALSDRDPAEPEVLGSLDTLYSVATSLALRDVGYLMIPPPDDIPEKYNVVMQKAKDYDADTKARALRMITLNPKSRDALLMAATELDDHLPDALASAKWRHGLYTNAALYANYRYDIVGSFLLGTKYDRNTLEQLSKRGKAKTYSDAELTEAFDCPYIRALRLFEAACEAADESFDKCYAIAGLSRESEWTGEDSVFAASQSKGTCEKERTAPIEDLRYQELDLGL